MSPQSGLADGAKDEFARKADELHKNSVEMTNNWNNVVKKVDKTLDDLWFYQKWDWFGGDDVDKLKNLVRETGKKLQGLVDDIAKVVRGSVPVLSLFDAAIRWSSEVQSPVSAISGRATTPAVFSLREWKGEAGEVYNVNVMPKQGLAIDGVTSTATATSMWLASVATSNLKFMLSLIEPTFNLIKSIVAAAVAAASVAGLLEAIGKAADAIGEVIVAVLKIIKATAEQVVGSLEKAIGALNIANNNTPFPGQHWPNPVTI